MKTRLDNKLILEVHYVFLQFINAIGVGIYNFKLFIIHHFDETIWTKITNL